MGVPSCAVTASFPPSLTPDRVDAIRRHAVPVSAVGGCRRLRCSLLPAQHRQGENQEADSPQQQRDSDDDGEERDLLRRVGEIEGRRRATLLRAQRFRAPFETGLARRRSTRDWLVCSFRR